jgi:hypothetical protein
MDPNRISLGVLPFKELSAFQLMCLMFAGFKRVAPEHDVGMDLNDSFLTALSLFQQKKDDHP